MRSEPVPGTTSELVAALVRWFDRLWPDPDRGAAAAVALREAFAGDDRPVDPLVCRQLETLVHRWSRHVELVHEDTEAAPDRDPPGWTREPDAAVHRRASGVAAVVRRPDGIAVLRIDGLDAAHLAAPYLDAAADLVRGAAGAVLDLRRNGGGDPATVAHLLDWVIGPVPTHISDVRYRDRTRQWWTAGRSAARALSPETPLAVLTGPGTYSSAEALAFHLQQRCGVPVVGAPTRGAADHVTPVRLTRRVRGLLPEAFVVDTATGRNWEGTGVLPDVGTDPDDAPDVAAATLLDRRAH
ncbi:S41 family peptidase [Nakamurella endophytica]|uniref:Tail specific protease domain-containing protein n=1 Tax=Nakamurella endophytica TaxID=1748367 RepID=A0A917T6W6_9ACTN|nr:S41 family peptidase [Nakamurella endophytica]GGM12493.1 hypothetical protein GCM10011594_35470 [Nakamurella endophytica]